MILPFPDPGARVLRSRNADALVLARLLLRYQYAPQLVAMMGADDWRTVAAVAQVPPPANEGMIRLVISMVEKGELEFIDGE